MKKIGIIVPLIIFPLIVVLVLLLGAVACSQMPAADEGHSL